MPTATQGSSEYTINQLNLAMRSTDWYQQWFQSQGLDPNKVKLSDRQRDDLTRVAREHGYQLGDRMKIDQAGNINQMGGFAGMPTWAKVAISAAPAAATLGFGAAGMGPAAGLFGGAGGSGVGAGGLGSGLSAAQAGAAAHAGSPLLMGSGFGAGAAGAAIPTITGTAIGSGMGTGPASLAGTSVLSGSMRDSLAGLAAGGAGGIGGAAKGLAEGAGRSMSDRLIGATVAGLAGLPGLLANRSGPSEQEQRYQAQIEALLKQQQQRTAFQNPLYEAVTKMAFGLMPSGGMGENAYPYNSLKDVG